MPLEVSRPTSLSLLQRACAHDQEAWRQLVHIYGPLVHGWCKRAGLREADTADVFQETFRAVLRELAAFRPRREIGSFRSWLRAVTRTKIADHFRQRQPHVTGQGGSDAQRRLANVADPLPAEGEGEAPDENALVVRRALELIRPEFSEPNWSAFWQVVMEGQSAVEVARRLNLNPQAVRQANYRIRRRLRLLLQDLAE
jgi:RNA polymerase sigma-70 factor (ECF subfamily)